VIAWALMAGIAISRNLLLGYGAHEKDLRTLLIFRLSSASHFFRYRTLTVRVAARFALRLRI